MVGCGLCTISCQDQGAGTLTLFQGTANCTTCGELRRLPRRPPRSQTRVDGAEARMHASAPTAPHKNLSYEKLSGYGACANTTSLMVSTSVMDSDLIIGARPGPWYFVRGNLDNDLTSNEIVVNLNFMPMVMASHGIRFKRQGSQVKSLATCLVLP